MVETISERALGSIHDRRDGSYAVYRLRKRGIDTGHAVSDIFARKGVRLRPLGLKDSSAVTEQFVCCPARGRAVGDFSTGRYSLERVGFVDRPLSKRDMVSNRFRVKITGCAGDPSSFDGHDRVLNFYGYQRFGSGRAVTHLVGRAIVQGDFAGAVDLILSFRSGYDSAENDEIRRMLSDPANYRECLGRVPAGMDMERIVLKGMAGHGDPARALRAVPLQMRRFYVQAYQSYIFNRSLSLALLDGEDLFSARPGDVCFDPGGTIGKHAEGLDQRLALPLVGHSYYRKTRFDHQISRVLQEEEVAARDFFIREMQEASGEGGFRQAVMGCSGYSSRGTTVEFSLSRGSYATVLLREVIRPDDPILAGF